MNITSNIWITGWWNLAFILTDGEPIITKLDSYGSLIWEDVIPSDNISGMFQIRNKGENGSVVHWKINTDDLPWGTKEDWTFSQEVGILSTRIDWINVYVNVTAPDKGPRRYKGTIAVENIMNPSDFCEIEVKCITPKTKDFNRFVPFQRFFENHPNLFPFFRHLLGL